MQTAGTYLKVIRFSEPTNPDGFVLLFLRPNERFLFLGYWAGYERTAASGTWTRDGRIVELTGIGTVSHCRGASRQDFKRTFRRRRVKSTRQLVADVELPGWSLLSGRGPLQYIGEDTVINPDGRWLPRTSAEVDQWIDATLPTVQ
jgi:hypothetical protein